MSSLPVVPPPKILFLEPLSSPHPDLRDLETFFIKELWKKNSWSWDPVTKVRIAELPSPPQEVYIHSGTGEEICKNYETNIKNYVENMEEYVENCEKFEEVCGFDT